ncbi:MAG: hypothetical protein ACXAD7_15535 [Candidatus Kariarchaeaceae archaeon]|jgi:hypothetical protein
MQVENYKAWNPNIIVKIIPDKRIEEALNTTNSVLQYLNQLKPEILTNYISALVNRIENVIENPSAVSGLFDLDKMTSKYKLLKSYPDLQKLILRFVVGHLKFQPDLAVVTEEIGVTSLDNTKAYERLSYHTAKAFADLLGDEDAIPLWKQIIAKRLEAEKTDYEEDIREREEKGEPIAISRKEESERSIKRWVNVGLGDFTIARFDNHKILYRFDKCLTHAALKDLNDPEWAYLCSCYIGDAPEFNFGKRYLRRTQTLHHGTFCDELYWDVDVHDNPEQPTLEFTQKLGRG